MPVTNLKAFQDLVASADAPHSYAPRRPVQLGPNNYSAAQSIPYSEQWFFEVSGTSVTIGRQDGLGFPPTIVSSLYDSAFETLHLTGCFDAVSREVLAWDLGENVSGVPEVRVGHFIAGVENWLTFEGFNPVAFNTWPIDGDAATAGDAETGVFYLRRGFPYLFFRTKGDDFATEYVVARSPSAPFALHSAAINGAYLEIRGLDVGHRKTAWRSLYDPAIPPDYAIATLELTVGDLKTLTQVANAGTDDAIGTLDLLTGSFDQVVIPTDPLSDDGAATLELTVGEFVDRLISTGLLTDEAIATLALGTGSFDLVAKQTELTSDAAAATLALTTGVFEIP
jgi:hypothetical protein